MSKEEREDEMREVVEGISYGVLCTMIRTLGFILSCVQKIWRTLNNHDGAGIFKGSMAAEGKIYCKRLRNESS